MCFLTVSSRPCLETSPHSALRTPFAGHCLGALWGGKPCPAELPEGVNRVLRTLSGDPPLPILQTPSAGHCLDAHGVWGSPTVRNLGIQNLLWECFRSVSGFGSGNAGPYPGHLRPVPVPSLSPFGCSNAWRRLSAYFRRVRFWRAPKGLSRTENTTRFTRPQLGPFLYQRVPH